MKLYYVPGACSLAPHIILEEMGIPYTAQKLSFEDDSLNRPEYSKINPMHAVPALALQDGTVITETSAIMQYIAEQKPSTNLVPRAGTIERTKQQQYLNFVTSELHPTFGLLWSAETFVKDEKARVDFTNNVKQKIADRLEVFNNWLNGKTYLMGEQFTVADAYAFTVISWSKYVDVKIDRYSNIPGYLSRVAERPAVLRTLKNEGLIK